MQSSFTRASRPRCLFCKMQRSSCRAKHALIIAIMPYAPKAGPACSMPTMLMMSESISTVLRPAPIASRSFSPNGALANRRFAIVSTIGRNQACCCAITASAGYLTRRSSTASTWVALRRTMHSRPRPIISASAAVSAAGSVCSTSFARTLNDCGASAPMSMASRAANSLSRSAAVRRTNKRIAEARSAFFAASATSTTMLPTNTPSSAFEASIGWIWAKYV